MLGVWEPGQRGLRGEGREWTEARSYSKGAQRFQLLLEALQDAEHISKALPSCCRPRWKGRNFN